MDAANLEKPIYSLTGEWGASAIGQPSVLTDLLLRAADLSGGNTGS